MLRRCKNKLIQFELFDGQNRNWKKNAFEKKMFKMSKMNTPKLHVEDISDLSDFMKLFSFLFLFYR